MGELSFDSHPQLVVGLHCDRRVFRLGPVMIGQACLRVLVWLLSVGNLLIGIRYELRPVVGPVGLDEKIWMSPLLETERKPYLKMHLENQTQRKHSSH